MKLKEKIEIYENFLHKINMFLTCCNNEGITELIRNADMWSYAHRRGEFLSDKQRDEIILECLKKLCDTPNADKITKERQEAWTKAQKQKEEAFLNNK